MAFKEGDILTNDQGQQVVLSNNQWVPVQQQASSPRAEMEARATAGFDPLRTLLTGVASIIPSGLAGTAQAINPFAEPGAGAEAVRGVREAITTTPGTPEGIAALQQFGQTIQPVAEAIQALERGSGDIGFDIGGPLGGAIGAALPTAIELAVPPLAAGKISQVSQALKTPIEGTLKGALEKGTVLTTDVFPPKTFVGKAAQKITERVPVIGTGKVRAAQQQTRIQALDDIAKEFDIDPGSAFEKDIVNSANRIFKRSQARAAELRTEAVTALNTVGDITPGNALKEIDTQIAKIQQLGGRGDQPLLESLQNIKGELAGNFERLKNIRTTIFDDISDIGAAKSPIRSGGDAVLSSVAGALSKDLDDAAVMAGKSAGANRELAKAANKWKASNRIFKDNFSKAKETELKKAFTKGKIQPEIINTVIKGGKPSELTRLHNNLDLAGRKSVQQQILKNSLDKANGNPTIFLNDLNRLNNRKAVDIFFKGTAKRELEGVKKFLDITRRAQEEAASIASQAEVTTLGLVGGTALAPAPVIGAATTIGLLGRGFESKAVRDLLLKLGKLPPASKKARDIANQITPLIAATTQEVKGE